MPKLYVLSGDDLGRSYEVAGDSAVLGRGKDADLVVRGGSVSRNHARLVRTAGGWRLTDLGSSNGVRVGGLRVQEADLADGETFHLGQIELRFRLEEALSMAPPPPPAPAPPAPATPAGGLELEGEWDEQAGLAIEPVRSAPARPTPAASAPRPAPGPGARQGAARRAEALGGGVAARGGVRRTSAGGRILQYRRIEDREGVLAGDVGQQTTGTRWLLYGLALAVFVALAYGAYTLASSAKRNAALVEQEAE